MIYKKQKLIKIEIGLSSANVKLDHIHIKGQRLDYTGITLQN